MNMGSIKSINVFTLMISVIIIIAENSNANGEYDLYIKSYNILYFRSVAKYNIFYSFTILSLDSMFALCLKDVHNDYFTFSSR